MGAGLLYVKDYFPNAPRKKIDTCIINRNSASLHKIIINKSGLQHQVLHLKEHKK